MSKIIVAGSLAYDKIMDFPGYFKDEIMPDKIHSLNVSFLVNDLQESFGGTAGNIAYNLALLGENPSIFARVGDKDFLSYQEWLTKNKIDISNIKIAKDSSTASAYIITDQNDNQITGFYPGAMKEPADMKKAPSADMAIISPQNPVDMLSLPNLFQKEKIPYIFDPGQQVTSLNGGELRKAIAGSKILIGNDYEMALIVKKTMWGIKQLLDNTEILITTLGPKGSMIQTGITTYQIPATKPDNTQDPTGAGDGYRAGLMTGILKGWDLEKSGKLASLVAVYSVENYGTQKHSFDWEELSKRYRQNFKEEL